VATFREIAYEFSGNAEPLLNTLRSIERHVRNVPDNKKIHLRAKADQARRELNALEDKLEELDSEHTDIRITAEIKGLVTQIATARQIIASLPEDKVLTVRLRETINRDLARVDQLIAKTMSGVEGLARSTDRVSRPMRNVLEPTFSLMGTLGRLSVILRRIPPLMAGVVMVFMATFIPAMLAATAAVAGLVSAIGALAAALGAVATAGLPLLIGLFQRFAKVLEARKAREAALNAETEKGAQSARDAAAADEQRHQAAIRVRDALEAVETAQRGVNEAEAQARENIATARLRDADATRRLGDAAREMARATTDAYRQIKDAAEDASDAIREVASAQLGVEEANLGLRQARLDLEEFRREAGLSRTSVDDLFKKFQDVNFDIDTGQMRKALAQASGGDTGTQLELEQRLLAVRRAQLNVAEATDRASDAERDAGRTTEEADRLRKGGINGVDSYRSAVEELADAQRESKEASKELRRLERQGIKNAPAVIAAQEGLRDAEQQLKEARHDRATVSRNLAIAEAQLSSQAAEAKRQMDELTDTERSLVGVIDAIAAAHEQTLAPAISKIFGALEDVGRRLPGVMRGAMREMEQLGEVWADQVRKFGDMMLDPMNLIKWSGFARAAAAISESFGGMVTSIFQILINVAAAAMPELQRLFKDADDALKGLADSSGDISGLQKFLKPAFKLLRDIVGTLVDLGIGLLNVFSAGSGPITDFTDNIRGAARAFREWTESEEGREKIREFFEDTLPFLWKMLTLLFRVGQLGLKIFQVMAPIAEPFVDMLGDIVHWVGMVVDAIDWLIGPFKGIIGQFLAFFVAGGWVVRGLRLVGGAIRNFPTVITGVVMYIERAIQFFTRPFRTMFGWLRRAFHSPAIRGWVSRMLTNIGGVLRGVWNVVTWPFRRAFDWLRGAFQGLGDFVRGVFSGIGDVFRGAINILIRAANWMIGQINRIHIKIPDIVPGVGGREIGFNIPKIAELAAGGLVTGDTLARVGEGRYKEAVLPLSDQVMGRLAGAIVKAMRINMGPTFSGRPSVAVAAGVGGATGTVIERVDVTLPPAPEGGVPDARYQAVQLGRELARRGGTI
jgi:hypothetical protein